MNYKDQIKDPRWQKKRLEILELYGFQCTNCQTKETSLHVHHFKYKTNHKIWEYNEDELTVLCEDCHKTLHTYKKRIEDSVPNDIYILGKVANLLNDLQYKWSNIDYFRTILSRVETDLIASMKMSENE